MGTTFEPKASISCAVCTRRSMLRPAITILAPSAASERAMAFPMPPPPPVTIATFSSNLPILHSPFSYFNSGDEACNQQWLWFLENRNWVEEGTGSPRKTKGRGHNHEGPPVFLLAHLHQFLELKTVCTHHPHRSNLQSM